MVTNITIDFLVTVIPQYTNVPMITMSTSVIEDITVYWLLFLQETFTGVSFCERTLSHYFSISNRQRNT
jgi:hypothetical protein